MVGWTGVSCALVWVPVGNHHHDNSTLCEIPARVSVYFCFIVLILQPKTDFSQISLKLTIKAVDKVLSLCVNVCLASVMWLMRWWGSRLAVCASEVVRKLACSVCE